MSRKRPVFANTKHLARERENRRRRFWRSTLIILAVGLLLGAWITFYIIAF